MPCDLHSEVLAEDGVSTAEAALERGVAPSGQAAAEPDRRDHFRPNHVHIPLSIPPRYAVSEGVGWRKGQSAIHLARGYFVSTVGRAEQVVRDYLRNQEKEDQRLDQLNQWKRPAAHAAANINWSRVSDPAQAALSGSHKECPQLRRGYLASRGFALGVVALESESVAPAL